MIANRKFFKFFSIYLNPNKIYIFNICTLKVLKFSSSKTTTRLFIEKIHRKKLKNIISYELKALKKCLNSSKLNYSKKKYFGSYKNLFLKSAELIFLLKKISEYYMKRGC